MTKETKKLIRRAAGRDPDAFTLLAQPMTNSMYRTAYAILQNDADALDAIQTTMLVMWEKLPSLKKPEYFRTWSTRILINCSLDIRDARGMEVPLESMEEPAEEDHYNMEWKEVLSVLGEKYRTIMELYYGQGYRISEIAKLLDIPESTVRTRLQRGRARMKRYYEKENAQESRTGKTGYIHECKA